MIVNNVHIYIYFFHILDGQKHYVHILIISLEFKVMKE